MSKKRSVFFIKKVKITDSSGISTAFRLFLVPQLSLFYRANIAFDRAIYSVTRI